VTDVVELVPGGSSPCAIEKRPLSARFATRLSVIKERRPLFAPDVVARLHPHRSRMFWPKDMGGVPAVLVTFGSLLGLQQPRDEGTPQ